MAIIYLLNCDVLSSLPTQSATSAVLRRPPTLLHMYNTCCALLRSRAVRYSGHVLCAAQSRALTSTTTLCIRSKFLRYSWTIGSSEKEKTAAVDAWQACAMTAPSGHFMSFSRSPRRAMYCTTTRTGPVEAAMFYCETPIIIWLQNSPYNEHLVRLRVSLTTEPHSHLYRATVQWRVLIV